MPTDSPIAPRFPPVDANGDGHFGPADLRTWAVHLYFLPGDGLLRLLSSSWPDFASRIGIGPADYGGLASGLISGFVWLGAFIGLVIVYEAVRDVDRRITQALSAGWADSLRRLRIAAAVLRARLRARGVAPRDMPIDVAEDLPLTATELRLLRAHLKLVPGFAFDAHDGAHELGIRVSQAEAALERLAALGLLSRAFGGDGVCAYTLSSAGRGYLVYRDLTPPREG